MSLPEFPRALRALMPEPDPDDPSTVLDAARAAHAHGEHARALAHYEAFFDRTAGDESGAYYGVRLSYCLGEWAELGEEYPPAHARLLWKKDECRRLLGETGDGERFQEYKAICEALGDAGSPVGVFLDLHERDPDLAAAVYRFISHELADFGLWSIASAYLHDPRKDYEAAVERFVESMQVAADNPGLGGEGFPDSVREWLVLDLGNLWRVLAHSGRREEAAALREWAEADARLKGHPGVIAGAFGPESPAAGTTT